MSLHIKVSIQHIRWRLTLEELSLKLIDFNNVKIIKVEPTLESLSENFALNEVDVLHPTSFKIIVIFQHKVKFLIKIVKEKHKV